MRLERIQKAWKFYRVKKLLGVGKKKTADVWICSIPFEARSADELPLQKNDLLYLFDKIEDVFVHNDGSVTGWFRAVHLDDVENDDKMQGNVMLAEPSRPPPFLTGSLYLHKTSGVLQSRS